CSMASCASAFVANTATRGRAVRFADTASASPLPSAERPAKRLPSGGSPPPPRTQASRSSEVTPFLFQVAPHEAGHGFRGRGALVDDAVDLFGDGHFDPDFSREVA